jgi:hypothetical protein
MDMPLPAVRLDPVVFEPVLNPDGRDKCIWCADGDELVQSGEINRAGVDDCFNIRLG